MTQFFSNETVSLEKSIENSTKVVKTDPEDIDRVYEIERCLEWIKRNAFHKVCLQFPDHLLPDAAEVAVTLQKALNQTVYILADTAYGSCCVDYVAAAHISADAVIHFGPVCFSKSTGELPFLNIYEKNLLDVGHFRGCLDITFQGKLLPEIVLDTPYINAQDEILAQLPSIRTIPIDCPNLENQIKDKDIVFVGDNGRKISNLKFSFKPQCLYWFDPSKGSEATAIVNYEQDERVLRRRYFLVEKIKDSNTLGIVIGTLGVSNYLRVIDRIKKLATLHGKKYYLISVGKPSVAKLANFPEVDIYVVITCAMNAIYDSRDYYKPIVTPYDVEIALNPSSNGLSFSYDFNTFASNPVPEKIEKSNSGDVSLITGNVRNATEDTGNAESDSEVISGTISVKGEGIVSLNSNHGAGFLAGRSWQGLEPKLGENQATPVTEGRKGIAQSYSHEKAEASISE